MNVVPDYTYKKLNVNVISLLVSVFLLFFGIVSNTIADGNTPQVVGGTEADPGEWPWMAALVLAPVENAFDGHFCGGTLIAPEWILTAGHCVADFQVHHIDVVLGRHNLNSNEGERISISQKFVHPDYNPRTLDSDLALLKLERMPSSQQPVQLNPTTLNSLQTINNNILSTVTGWGNTSSDGMDYPETLQEVELPLVDRDICNSPESYDGAVTINMICAGYQQGGEDSCKGDSGGPLMIFDEIQSEWIQAGVVSWGEGCAEPNHYGVYTNLGNFLDWVTQETTVSRDNEQVIWLPIIITR